MGILIRTIFHLWKSSLNVFNFCWIFLYSIIPTLLYFNVITGDGGVIPPTGAKIAFSVLSCCGLFVLEMFISLIFDITDFAKMTPIRVLTTFSGKTFRDYRYSLKLTQQVSSKIAERVKTDQIGQFFFNWSTNWAFFKCSKIGYRDAYVMMIFSKLFIVVSTEIMNRTMCETTASALEQSMRDENYSTNANRSKSANSTDEFASYW